MNNELVLRLITLVSKNGDRIVLADPSSGKGVVVMDLDSYERLNAALDEVQALPPAVSAPAPVMPPQSVAAIPHRSQTYPQGEPVVRHVAESQPSFHEDQYRRQVSVSAHAITSPQNRAEVRETAPFVASEPPVRRGPGRPRRQTSSFESGPATQELADLTQEDVLDKINRDIGNWKGVKERRPENGQRTAAPDRPYLGETDALEDEEKFYLEPIE